MRTTRTLGLLGLLTIGVTVLSGCTPGTEESAPVGFEGPWAAEFEASYAATDSEFVRSVLEDGVITDQEYAEMFERFRSCLRTAGITVTDVGSDGSFSTHFPESLGPDAANDATKRCSVEAGENHISSLYHFVARNPQHLDEAEMVVACLIDAEVVEPSYSPDDFKRESPTGSFSLIDQDAGWPVLKECMADPLGIVD